MIALLLGEDRLSKRQRRREIINDLQLLPEKIKKVLALESEIKEIAEKFYKKKSLLIMGRGFQYATALEGALKIKEISYMHSEGILTGELKHGTLALVDDQIPIIMIATRDSLFDKVQNGISQVIARGGNPIMLIHEKDEELLKKGFICIEIPSISDCLQGILNIIPFQLLSYHIAILRGHNVDQPRNLAKSVTVE
jgi:glucosamine--fructose-6-phosphate aminotransferase (isomerizing)